MSFNTTGLELIGEGHHGTVYRLDDKRCIKFYKKPSFLQMEYDVLELSKHFPYFPRVYERGEDYMIREYIEGTNLWEYLQAHGLTREIATKILEIIDAFVELNYSKLDCHLHHLLITTEGQLKMIDPTTNMSRQANYPRALLRQLRDLDLLEDFLGYTKELRPNYYQQWIKHC